MVQKMRQGDAKSRQGFGDQGFGRQTGQRIDFQNIDSTRRNDEVSA